MYIIVPFYGLNLEQFCHRTGLTMRLQNGQISIKSPSINVGVWTVNNYNKFDLKEDVHIDTILNKFLHILLFHIKANHIH